MTGDRRREQPSLGELLDEGRKADPSTRVATYREAIAAHGSAAIEGVAPWLDEEPLRRFAIIIIEAAGQRYSGRDAAIRELRRVRASTPDPDFLKFVEATLVRLGASPDRKPTRGTRRLREDLPPGTMVAPPYRLAHHIVVDYVADSETGWGDIYLFACRLFFSGKWVRQKGGLKPPYGLPICTACGNAIVGGA